MTERQAGRAGLITVFASVWLLAACSTRTVADDYCLLAQPIIASESDSVETLRQVLQHNETYTQICGQE